MERRLLRAIINPAFVAMTLFGGLMFWANPALLEQGWIHVKLALLFVFGGGSCAVCAVEKTL
jgi:putative membrane protein